MASPQDDLIFNKCLYSFKFGLSSKTLNKHASISLSVIFDTKIHFMDDEIHLFCWKIT